MRKIIHGSAMWGEDPSYITAQIETGSMQAEDRFYPHEEEWSQLVGGGCGPVAPYAEPTLPAEELKRIAGQRRDARLIEPVFVDLGGHIIKIKMDAPGRAGLSEAVMTATMDPSATFRWTSSDGEVTLTAEQMKGCALVATRMAQEIRNRYADLVALIDEWKVTKASQITFGQ